MCKSYSQDTYHRSGYNNHHNYTTYTQSGYNNHNNTGYSNYAQSGYNDHNDTGYSNYAQSGYNNHNNDGYSDHAEYLNNYNPTHSGPVTDTQDKVIYNNSIPLSWNAALDKNNQKFSIYVKCSNKHSDGGSSSVHGSGEIKVNDIKHVQGGSTQFVAIKTDGTYLSKIGPMNIYNTETMISNITAILNFLNTYGVAGNIIIYSGTHCGISSTDHPVRLKLIELGIIDNMSLDNWDGLLSIKTIGGTRHAYKYNRSYGLSNTNYYYKDAIVHLDGSVKKDTLKYKIYYRHRNFGTTTFSSWVHVADVNDVTSYIWNTSAVPNGQVEVKIKVTDGHEYGNGESSDVNSGGIISSILDIVHYDAPDWDEPIIPGDTFIKWSHVSELQAENDRARGIFGMSDSPCITQNEEFIKADAVTELKSKVQEISNRAGRGNGTWTTTPAKGELVKDGDITDIRNMYEDLENI